MVFWNAKLEITFLEMSALCSMVAVENKSTTMFRVSALISKISVDKLRLDLEDLQSVSEVLSFIQ